MRESVKCKRERGKVHLEIVGRRRCGEVRCVEEEELVFGRRLMQLILRCEIKDFLKKFL